MRMLSDFFRFYLVLEPLELLSQNAVLISWQGLEIVDSARGQPLASYLVIRPLDAWLRDSLLRKGLIYALEI